MKYEIERKFLVICDKFKEEAVNKFTIRQGYLSSGALNVIRVRTMNDKAFITIKSNVRVIARMEFEYEIPIEDANILLDRLCIKPVIEKRRYIIPYEGHTWEVDTFFGENEGLVFAEVELSATFESVKSPPWVGKEVTGNPIYYNSNLREYPYRKWTEAEKAGI